MPRSTYSDEQKADALALYVDHGPSEAAKQTGIPKQTIATWAKRDGLATVRHAKTVNATRQAAAEAEQKREDLKRELLSKSLDLLSRMDEPHQEFVGTQGKDVTYDRAPAAAVKAYATSVGILIDKLRLEEGASTSREEHINVSEVDRELDRLAAELRGRASSPLPVADHS